MDNFIREEVKGKRSQDLPVYYRLSGAVYIASVQMLTQHQTFFLEFNSFAYVMNQASSVDIDNEIDFFIADYFS